MSILTDLTTAYNTQKTAFLKQMEVEFHKAFKEFFDAVPEIHGFFWTQYTPHFNDGEPCTFDRHDINYVLTRKVSDEEDLDDGLSDEDYYDEMFAEWEGENVFDKPGEYCYKSDSAWAKETVARYEAKVAELGPRFEVVASKLTDFVNELSALPQELYEDFGDGVKIIVTRDGFNVEEYDHD